MADDLDAMTIAELKELAEERGIAVPASPKQAIIDAIREADEPEDEGAVERTPDEEEPVEISEEDREAGVGVPAFSSGRVGGYQIFHKD